MTQYINKFALVEVLKSNLQNAEAYLKLHKKDQDEELYDSFRHEKNLMCALLSFLDTLEVKDVDLEKELNETLEKAQTFINDDREVKYYNGDSFNHIYELEFIAKHFFELGLRAQKGE